MGCQFANGGTARSVEGGLVALYVVAPVLGDNAMTQRVRATCGLLKSCGFKVDVLCAPSVSAKTRVSPDKVGCRDVLYADGGSFFGLGEDILAGNATRSIEDYCKVNAPSLILMYGSGLLRVGNALRIANSSGVPVIVEETDWFSIKPPSMRDVLRGVHYSVTTLNHNLSRRFVDVKASGQIVASRFLYDYYKGRGANPVYVPALVDNRFDVSGERLQRHSGDVRLVYAGSPGRHEGKDMISPLLNALECFKAELGHLPFQLFVVGMDRSDIERVWRSQSFDLDELRVRAFGRKTHDETLRLLKDSDFGVLIRRKERYAKAGFSTKFVEYLSCGLPVICNEVGGADLYIEDGVDGFVANEPSQLALFDVLLTIACMTREDVEAMRKCAFEKAKSTFVPELYESEFRHFVFDIIGSRSPGQLFD